MEKSIWGKPALLALATAHSHPDNNSSNKPFYLPGHAQYSIAENYAYRRIILTLAQYPVVHEFSENTYVMSTTQNVFWCTTARCSQVSILIIDLQHLK